MVLGLGSCQEEFEELPVGADQEAIKASSSTGKLIQKASSKNGSFDDIVDGAGCFAINFPYVVHVNGFEITIETVADLKKVEEVLDGMDDDILDIMFPITITLSDFSEISIHDGDQLEDLVEECLEGGDDEDIACIDFIYPLTLYSFDVDLQRTGQLTVENDMQLRRYFSSLDDDDLISFEFPISLKLYGGDEISIDNNAELADAIEKADDTCDDDDDDNITQEAVEEYLVSCPWSIMEVVRGGQDNTGQYSEFTVHFNADGSVTAKEGTGTELPGTWSTGTIGKKVKLKLEFDGVDDFSLEWFVDDMEEGELELVEGMGNEIEMQRICQ
ncbi:MAG TPA: hypothetical protein VLZ54_02725, partial [Arenibacter sp.]|nr:hypothetical protein [Arenibacter sp.]